MNAGSARAAAQGWVADHYAGDPSFVGAYFTGSAADLPAGAELPPDSDLDVIVVLSGGLPPEKPGKFMYRGALLEITCLPWAVLSSAEEVLTSHHLGHGLRRDTVFTDPSGLLRPLQRAVGLHFNQRPWVRRRCENVLGKIRAGLSSADPTAPFYDQVTGWLFPTGIMTHIVLLAALQNPTVRKRYLAARGVLLQYGHGDFYEDLLGLLGCRAMTAGRAGEHLAAMTAVFDAAAAVARTHFSFSSDITPLARPIAVDGSRRLIGAGDHREAVFWITATFARCLKILAADAPEQMDAHLPAFAALADDLGVGTPGAVARRAGDAQAFLPGLWQVTEQIMAANPGITE